MKTQPKHKIQKEHNIAGLEELSHFSAVSFRLLMGGAHDRVAQGGLDVL